jgi:hypothetical protein
MDTYTSDRELVEQILSDYAHVPYTDDAELETQTIFDRIRDRYLLMNVGWETQGSRKERLYYPLIQIDIIDGKFWVQHDGTDVGIARELERAGVPKNRIVLAFRERDIRTASEYAVE